MPPHPTPRHATPPHRRQQQHRSANCPIRPDKPRQVSCGFAGDAFAAIRSDGRVVTWGWAESGGDSSRVEGRLREVQELQADGRLKRVALGVREDCVTEEE